MENTNNFNVYKKTKPLFVSSGYGVLAALFCLIIPLLPIYDLDGYGKNCNVFKAIINIFKIIPDFDNIEVIFYFIIANWFVFAILAFTVFFIVRLVFAGLAVMKARQFAVFYTDKIYIVMFSMSCLFFLVGFVLNVFYSGMEIFDTYFIIPTTYVYMYGVISLLGIVVNFVCKMLCAPLRAHRGNLCYMGGKALIYFIFVLLAAFSSLLFVKRGDSVYAMSFFSSAEDGAVFIRKGVEFYIDLCVFENLMFMADCGPVFMYLVIALVTVSVVFVFFMFIKSLEKLLCFNSDKVLAEILEKGAETGEEVFEENKRFVPETDQTWKILAIFGGVTLIWHLVAFPITRVVDDIGSGVSFSIAPILAVFMLLVGLVATFGLKYFNGAFSGKPVSEDDSYESFADETEELAIADEKTDVSPVADTRVADTRAADNDYTYSQPKENNSGDDAQNTGMFCDF